MVTRYTDKKYKKQDKKQDYKITRFTDKKRFTDELIAEVTDELIAKVTDEWIALLQVVVKVA